MTTEQKIKRDHTHLIGSIDQVVAGHALGWAASKNSDSALIICLYGDDKLLGQSLAEHFRRDLLEAGIGNGRHGFTIPIDPEADLSSIKSFELRELDTDSPIAHNDFKLDLSTLYTGNIEQIVAGQIYGWAAQIASSDQVDVAIYAGDRLIGHGVADLFRKDLETSGIGNGCYGFCIPIKDDFDTTSAIEIKLNNAENNHPIKHPEYQLKPIPQRIWVTVTGGREHHIKCMITSSEKIGRKKIVMFEGDTKIAEQPVSTNEQYCETGIVLPISQLDGKVHAYRFGIEGYPFCAGMHVCENHPVLTPWQYLTESHQEPGFISLSKHADHRYESLNYQLDSLIKGGKQADLKNLSAVHQIVVQGHENRKEFRHFSLPRFDLPKVSIIVPAYNKFALTYHCIASIALAHNKTSFEVILADDNSSDETANAEDLIDNLVISRNETNLRFLLSCNRASELAKGEYLIFLNNDTEVTSFWIDELISKMEQDEQIGLTGSKLLNLDGTLQEAGGIVWGNGQPWNVGRDANPYNPEYNYVREVDYLSGASMCIRKSIWSDIGRFSEELAPCYYEDTDLAFKVREAGYKTVYIPHSQVIHFEGQSHGTDVTKGLKRYQVVNEKSFRLKWFKQYKNHNSPSLNAMATEKDRNIDHRILVIDHTTPTPNKDAGSYAAIQEIKLMISLGFKVTFAPENLAHMGKYTNNLQRMGVEVLYAPFYSSMKEVFDKRLPEMDAVYITRYQVAENHISAIRSSGDIKILFNNADLHFLREIRAANQGAHLSEEMIERITKTRESELNVCRNVDAILCYNTTEHAVISSHTFQTEKLHLTPWVLDKKDTSTPFEQRTGISFLGNYLHPPNREAVKVLIDEIMPRLAESRPDIHLYLYGSHMPDEYFESTTDNIKVIGFAESLNDVYQQHRLFVAPLMSGAGIKGKVLESMAYQLPSVLTTVAAEGTGLTHGISALIADTVDEWVEMIIKLYDDEELWKKFAETVSVICDEQYSFQHGHKAFKKIFESIGIYSTT